MHVSMMTSFHDIHVTSHVVIMISQRQCASHPFKSMILYSMRCHLFFGIVCSKLVSIHPQHKQDSFTVSQYILCSDAVPQTEVSEREGVYHAKGTCSKSSTTNRFKTKTAGFNVFRYVLLFKSKNNEIYIVINTS